MKIAIVSDIHANLAALQAVLADIDAVAPDAAIWHTGDIVGYNAEPNEVVALLRERGAAGVMGNHDAAVLGELDVLWFNPEAAAAVKWTATHLTPENATWLHALPKISEMGAATLVHASLLKPLEEYVIDAESARENLFALSTPVLFHGHTHVPAYWAMRGGQASLIDRDGHAQPLLSPSLINVGSVGQPRDGDVRASWVLWDRSDDGSGIGALGTVQWRRVAYDVARTQSLVRAAGLPERLATRLAEGH
ncbi:MAG: metallophosphoesterase [Chloroflexi bacterium]|nr:MAG: metallophosphoesterase [Chloroflexota bacterium]